MEIDKNYRERRVQPNKPVQCGGNGNITEKYVKSRQCTDVDCATGSFCSSCSIPPPTAYGLWSSGKGCAMCNYDDNGGG